MAEAVVSVWFAVASILIVSSSAVDSKQFVQTFAPNCGVQVQTLGPITGRLLGCQGSYIPPSEAFSTLLVPNAKSLEILYDRNHTQVGAAVSGSDGGGPYFWCVLFSSGKANNTFVLDSGVVKMVSPGCFSGNNDDCSESMRFQHGLWKVIVAVFISMAYAFTF